MTPRVVCVIPARGGSKGIPGKNLLRLAGETLVGRAVRISRAATHVSETVVSTDDPDIAAESERYGARVIRRPAALAGDEASTESALLHVLEVMEESGDPRPDVLAFVQCTSPFTESTDVDGTIALVLGGADSAFAAVSSHLFLWRRGSNGYVQGVNHDAARRPRRQDRQPDLIESGAVYAMRTDGFRSAGHRFFGLISAYEMPAERWLEIDCSADVDLARVRVASSETAMQLPNRIDAVVFDFDGVMTDDLVTLSEDGVESVRCSRADGYGIEQLRHAGVTVAVLSREKNPIVRARCEKLGVECMQGVADKASLLAEWLRTQNVLAAHMVYVGNDLPDLPCLRLAGFGVAVADAHIEVKAQAHLVLRAAGGHGAVRELCDIVLMQRTSNEDKP